MATQINIDVVGNFLLIEDTSTGNVTNYPLSFTSYEIFTPKDSDSGSVDHKNYLYFNLLDGSRIKNGGYDIFCTNADYTVRSVELNRLFTSLDDLTSYLDNNLAVPTALPYKVFTALLTQNGASNPDSFSGNGGTLDKGYTYEIVANPDNYDLTIYGAPNNNAGTSFLCTVSVPSLPYTSSLELGVNYGTPVATVLENTIGDMYFSYDGVGNYSINSNGLFTLSKTAVFGQSFYHFGGDYIVNLNTYWEDNTENYIKLTTSKDNGNDLAIGNNLINGTTIEIRVYN